MTQTVGCLTEEGSIGSSVQCPSSPIPSFCMPWPPIPATDSRGRDSSRQSLKRCRWTGRVVSFLLSPGEALNSRAVSSPLFTSHRDWEISGKIYRWGGEKRQVMSFLSVLPDLPNTNSTPSLLLLTNPSRFCVPRGPLTTLPRCVDPVFICSKVILIEQEWCGSRSLCAQGEDVNE